MIIVYSDSSIHRREVARYPDLPTLAREFKPKFGQVQDFEYWENTGYTVGWISWTAVLKEMQKYGRQKTRR